jgi:hypothetical protein
MLNASTVLTGWGQGLVRSARVDAQAMTLPVFTGEDHWPSVCDESTNYGQATKSMREDALALVGDEGRG